MVLMASGKITNLITYRISNISTGSIDANKSKGLDIEIPYSYDSYEVLSVSPYIGNGWGKPNLGGIGWFPNGNMDIVFNIYNGHTTEPRTFDLSAIVLLREK